MCFFVYFAKPHEYKKQHPMHLQTRRKIVIPRSTKLAWTSLVWFFWEGSCTSLPQEDVCAACVFQGHGHLWMIYKDRAEGLFQVDGLLPCDKMDGVGNEDS